MVSVAGLPSHAEQGSIPSDRSKTRRKPMVNIRKPWLFKNKKRNESDHAIGDTVYIAVGLPGRIKCKVVDYYTPPGAKKHYVLAFEGHGSTVYELRDISCVWNEKQGRRS